MDPLLGAVVSHYKVLEQIGAGGMGVVYLAEDERLHRKVALKFIAPSFAGDAVARRRLLREAQAACALDHPNIATVYEVGDFQDQLFIAMAYYQGETLKRRIERGPLPIAEASSIAEHIAGGLEAAHNAGVIHRDLKPANVFITSSRQVKILDFGLAKVDVETTDTTAGMTETGTTLGTLSYMAPEQARGERVDKRADVWAFGVLLFEMLTGRQPFHGNSVTAILLALASEPAPSLSSLRPDAPAEFDKLVERALVKDANHRTLTAAEAARAIAQYRERTASSAAPSFWRSIRRPLIAVPLAAVILAAIGATVIVGTKVSNQRWAKYTAVPEVARLAERQHFVAAVELAQQAQSFLGDDRDLAALWPRITRPITIESDPPGVSISYAEYGTDPVWRRLGTTPLKQARLPNGLLRVKAEKPGFDMAEDVTFQGAGGVTPTFRLAASGTAPEGMVRAAPAQRLPIYVLGLENTRVKFDGFWVDRYEVSNRQYKVFVDAGGYKRPEFWQQQFVRDGKILGFDEAMGLFRDATGRPGPAAWTLGNYPAGEDGLPVTGVSWFEAAAYAAFAGKALPTVYHWYSVASQGLTGYVIPLANFASTGPVRTTDTRALHRYGTYGLAGNVKEWCINEAPGNRRYILGGGWDEPPYQFRDPDARSPFDRGRNFGFRTVRYDDGDASVPPLSGLLLAPARNYAEEKPVSDDVFRAYRSLYSYDKTDLAPKSESVDDAHVDWRVEKVSVAAAYGQERFVIYIFVPKQGRPPYQTVVFMPAGGAWDQRMNPSMAEPAFAFLLRSGRAVAFPIYKGTYERSHETLTSQPKATSLWRDYTIMLSKDFGRAVDYLETRPDIDRSRMAFLGFSRGASLSPIVLAQDGRIKAAALWIPGLYRESLASEVDPINFTVRVTIPILQLSGRYDYTFPAEPSSIPFFHALGTPPDHKRRVVYDTGHNLPPNESIRETLDWFDRYLGSPQ